jgi:acetyl esterase
LTVDLVTPENRIPVASVDNIEIVGRPARVYRPEGDAPKPTLLYFHGGGFVVGDLDTHDQVCRRFAVGAGAVVVSFDYRLAPEARFPAAVEDCLMATKWVAGQLAVFGGSDTLAVGGDSAGANLAAVVAQQRPQLIDAQVLIYPVTDPSGSYPSREENGTGYFLETATMEWFHHHYVPDDAALGDVWHSPLRADPVTIAATAPAVIFTAEFDPLRDEGEAYAAALSNADVEVELVRYDGMIHGFMDMGLASPAAAAAVEDVIARTKTLLDRQEI